MIHTLQSLRFIFIMLVVLSHYIGSSFDFGGECGVSFFFMLSGFVLSLAYSERISIQNTQISSALCSFSAKIQINYNIDKAIVFFL